MRRGSTESFLPNHDEFARRTLLHDIRTQVGFVKSGEFTPAESVFEGAQQLERYSFCNHVEQTGYAGIAYINWGKNEIIIASPPSMRMIDVRSLSAIYHGFIPIQYEKSLKPYLDSIITKIISDGLNPKSYTYLLTGFSLGAALSDLGAAYLHERGFEVSTCGVDNPGTGKIYSKVRDAARREAVANGEAPHSIEPFINNYVMSEQTIANSLNPQVGVVYTISENNKLADITQQLRSDRIFSFCLALQFTGGLAKHNTAQGILADQNVLIKKAKTPAANEQHTASYGLRIASTCLAAPILTSLLLVASPFIAIYKLGELAIDSIKDHANRDLQNLASREKSS